jgi:vacuolar-type H+-ATPase subunit E/Vma4
MALKKALTRAQYAQYRGVSRQMVERYISEGKIPVRNDGLINSAQADAALARRSIKAAARPTLAKAQLRKLRASVALLSDELEQAEENVLPPDEVAAAWDAMGQRTCEEFDRMAAELAPELAGRKPGEAFKALTAEVRDVLDALSKAEIIAVPSDRDLALAKDRSEEDLDKLSMLELAARKTDLQAKMLEHRRAVRRGELLPQFKVTKLAQQRVSEVRALVLSLPTRLAPRFEMLDETQAATMLQTEVATVLKQLERPLF